MITMMGNMFGKRRDLRFTILAVLRSGPKNGAEIMDSVEKMTFGMWRPSPGSLYPMLQKMVDENMIKKDSSGAYSLTQESDNWFGMGHMHNPFSGNSPRNFDEAIDEIKGLVNFLEDIKANGSTKLKENMDELDKIADRIKKLTVD